MKKLLKYILLSLIISSCIDIRFQTHQPMGGKTINEFPSNIIGSYDIIMKDSLTERNRVLLERKKQNNKDKGHAKHYCTEKDGILEVFRDSINCPFLRAKLEDKSLILKQYSDSLFILNIANNNTLHSNQNWWVFPFKFKGDTIFSYSVNFQTKTSDIDFVTEIGKITFVEEVMKDETKKRRKKSSKKNTFSHYLINPTEEDFSKILSSDIFKEFVVLKKQETLLDKTQ